MKNSRLGSYITASTIGEKFSTFIPASLPFEPPLKLDGLQSLIEKANQALGRLDGLTSLLPDTALFMYSYVRKEALLSSQIEGTQSSFSDLLLFENDEIPGVPVNDVEEVSLYVASITHGLKRLRSGFPLSLRLICEIHKILLSNGRGSNQQPGEFRRSQNWIGGTRPGNAVFVPPPADKVMEGMGNLELYLNDEFGKIPTLIKAAIAHVQFETIHPFLDGNGRIGRLLITLLLCHENALKEPGLYLSLYFKQHRQQYYKLLQQVRTEGSWETWLEFFLQGILETSEAAAQSARQILELFKIDREKIASLKRAAASAYLLFEYLQKKVLCSVPKAGAELKLSPPTVTAALKNLEKIGIVKEMSGKKRNRVFAYHDYLRILKKDTEPL